MCDFCKQLSVLGTFENLQKATISYVMSVCSCKKQFGLSRNLIYKYLKKKICQENSSFIIN